jgi:hypothetical protein
VSIHYKVKTAEDKAMRQYQFDAALHCTASVTVIVLHMNIIVPDLYLRKYSIHMGRL